MSNDLNQCSFIGNLGKDPIVRYTPENKAITSFSIAVGEQWKNAEGNKQEKTTWVNIVIFGGLAEIAGKYLNKGSKVYVSGRMVNRKWQDNNGNDKYSTEVVLDQFNGKMQMLSSAESKPNQQTQNQPQQQSQQQLSQQKQDYSRGFDDSEIPF